MSAAGQTFDGWSAHVEVGSGEDGETSGHAEGDEEGALDESWDGVVNGLRVAEPGPALVLGRRRGDGADRLLRRTQGVKFSTVDCQLCPRAFGRSTTRIDWDLHSYLPKWQSAKSKYCSQSYSARSWPPRRMW